MDGRNKLVLAVLMGLLLLFAGCSNGTSDEPLRIGALLVLSGDAAAWGKASQNAIELAVDEVNKAGGIDGREVIVLYEDTQGSAVQAVAGYRKLSSLNGVVAIIGPNWQTAVSAIAPLAAADRFPVITPSYAPLENRPDPRNPLLIWMDPTIQAQRIARYVYEQGARTAAVIGTEDSWEKQVSLAFADEFTSLGGTVDLVEILQPDAENVQTSVTKVLQDKPDAVFVGTYFQFLSTTRVLEEFGYQGKVYSIEVDEYLAQESKEFTTGLQFISLDLYSSDFRTKYEAAYGEKSNIPAGQTYDTMKILLSMLEDDPSRDRLLFLFERFESYEGVSGAIRMTEDHKTIFPTAIYELHEGDIIRVEATE